MLHLAAWNQKVEMFDHLIDLGADLGAENKDGLTAFTVSVRFGRWKMFRHIWNKHFTKQYWRFGNVEADVVNYSQFESSISGLGRTLSFRELGRQINTLLVLKMTIEVCHLKGPNVDNLNTPKGNTIVNKLQSPAVVQMRIRAWCERRLRHVVTEQVFEAPKTRKRDKSDNHFKFAKKSASPSQDQNTGTPCECLGCIQTFNCCRDKVNRNKDRIQQVSPQFKSATEIITMFRPEGWYDNTKDLMKKVVLGKWSKGYYLVYLANTMIPYGVVLLLFVLMWWQRKLSILEHNFWWSKSAIVAHSPDGGIEGACGWTAILDSHSGRLQAVLIIYGVPSLLRLAQAQSRLRLTDLDEDLNWKMAKDEIVNFLFMNLESLLHVIAAGLFVTIGSARVSAQRTSDMYQCDVSSLRTEKNATSIVGLLLFFNLFIVCQPYQDLGVLVQTMYRFLLKDVFNFLVMYGMLFLAFLLALQTLHNANVHYLQWMDATPEILPLVEKAQNLTYLANNNPPSSASSLLATETELQGCWNKGRTLTETAFALLEISFGDGLADAIEQARSKPFECASDPLHRGYLG